MGGLRTNKTVNGFAVDPTNPQIMYVAIRDGLYKSTDAGNNWKSAGSELKTLAAVTINPKNPSQIYVATAEGKIFASADGALKWQAQ